MNKFTKITASIGPKCSDKETLTRMIKAGVNMCRLNFSHDTGDVQGQKIDTIREISADLGIPVAILADLQGPKHRIGNFETEDKFPITVGQKYVLDTQDIPGNSERVQLPDSSVFASIKVGERVLLNDGKIELRVDSVSPDKLETTVIRGTEIWSRRGFNVPDTELDTSVLTKKDREVLEYVLTKNPDWVAISFVQKPEDVIEVREFVKARTDYPVKILAKIERPNAVERVEDIIAVADGIMIARGDLAVEVPFETIPSIGRNIIWQCRKHNKPVIVATQMLGSMVDSAFPTRAEITDVANAAYLRADSTMTSEETTIGHDPVHTVETMAKILINADMDTIENPFDWSRIEHLPEKDLSRSFVSMANLKYSAAIVVFAEDATATTQISCRKSEMPIIAVCKDCVTANQLALSRGVFSFCDSDLYDKRDAFNACRRKGINEGQLVIVDGEKISLRTIS